MDRVEAAKWAALFLLSTVKLFFAPAAAVAAGLRFWQAWLVTATGGMSGVVVFYYFGHAVFSFVDRIRLRRTGSAPPIRKSFTRRNRWVVAIKGKFGIIGLAAVTPTILSIPIGSVIAARFYYNNSRTLPYLLVSTVIWTFLLSFFFAYLESLLLS